jgi:archaellum biogenesis protein FlaJ (TadC family)
VLLATLFAVAVLAVLIWVLTDDPLYASVVRAAVIGVPVVLVGVVLEHSDRRRRGPPSEAPRSQGVRRR